MYTVASPDPNPRGVNYVTLRVQFYANERNEGRDANECNSTLVSVIYGSVYIIYSVYIYIYSLSPGDVF